MASLPILRSASVVAPLRLRRIFPRSQGRVRSLGPNTPPNSIHINYFCYLCLLCVLCIAIFQILRDLKRIWRFLLAFLANGPAPGSVAASFGIGAESRARSSTCVHTRLHAQFP